MCDFVCFFKQKTAYEMRISDWSSDGCSSDLYAIFGVGGGSAATNPLNGAQGDAYRGYDNQDHLKKGYQRLRLAMTEAVIAIRGHGGEANAEQRHKAGGEIKRGIGERPKHRH